MVDVAPAADITFGGIKGTPYLTELLISDVSKLLKDILKAGRYAGGAITVSAGVVTVPAGSVFLVDSGQGLVRVEFTSALTVTAAQNDEVYLNLALTTAEVLTVVLEAAAAAPTTALKLGVATGGPPPDTFTEEFTLDTGIGEGAGAAAASGVVAQESGGAAMHRTVLTLTDVVVPSVTVTTANGFGGTKIYDFPAGMIQHLGMFANLSIRVATAEEPDFTDNTPEGDIGLGSVIIANADAMGTDATDDDFATAAAFAMTAFLDPAVPLPTEATANFDGTSTPIDLNLNVLVDAADQDDDNSSEVLISGTITFTWTNLGDNP